MKGFLSSKHKKFSFNFYKIVYLPFKIDYMDLKDRMILSIIQEDSTLSVKEISEKLVLLLLQRMNASSNWRKTGIIEKYVGLLNREKLGLNIVVYCNVRLKEQSKKVLETFEKNIMQHDEVQEIISLSGEYDYMLKIIAKDINSYNDFTVNVISNIPNIGQYHSSIVLHEVKKSTKFKIDLG
jgi:DNA-binding Lrp family transcriptional regulator